MLYCNCSSSSKRPETAPLNVNYFLTSQGLHLRHRVYRSHRLRNECVFLATHRHLVWGSHLHRLSRLFHLGVPAQPRHCLQAAHWTHWHRSGELGQPFGTIWSPMFSRTARYYLDKCSEYLVHFQEKNYSKVIEKYTDIVHCLALIITCPTDMYITVLLFKIVVLIFWFTWGKACQDKGKRTGIDKTMVRWRSKV